MRKLPIIAATFLFAVSCSPGGDTRSGVSSGDDTVSEGAEAVAEFLTSDESVRPWANNIGKYHEVFNDSNHVQYEVAEKLGIVPINSLKEAYNTSRPLVKIESGDFFEVDDLTHSMPFLVPEAASLLNEIGKDFGDLLENRGGDRNKNRLIITSLLRSPYTVKKLRRINRNAVDSSTHMFGTTFDIAWNNFHYPDSAEAVDAGVLKGILAEVLLKKRNEGKCFVKYERKTPCFHITVRK